MNHHTIMGMACFHEAPHKGSCGISRSKSSCRTFGSAEHTLTMLPQYLRRVVQHVFARSSSFTYAFFMPTCAPHPRACTVSPTSMERCCANFQAFPAAQLAGHSKNNKQDGKIFKSLHLLLSWLGSVLLNHSTIFGEVDNETTRGQQTPVKEGQASSTGCWKGWPRGLGGRGAPGRRAAG